MNKEANIIDSVLARLEDLTGIEARFRAETGPLDGTLDLSINNEDLHLYAECKIEFKPYHLLPILEYAKQYKPFILIADRIYPAQKKALRENGINYLDSAGNIYLKENNYLIWLEGNKPIEEERTTNRAFTKAGLKTVFYFLLNEDTLNLPYRTLAQATGGALGNMKYIIDGLADAGFILQIDAKKKVFQNKRQLLERWITGYQEVLKPTLHIGNFNFLDKNEYQHWHTLIAEDNKTVWGGEAAAELLSNYLKAIELTAYTDKDKISVIRDWRVIPHKEGYLKVYEKFWTDAYWDTKKLAPALLMYADLIIANDPRCTETAMIIYNKFLKDEFELR